MISLHSMPTGSYTSCSKIMAEMGKEAWTELLNAFFCWLLASVVLLYILMLGEIDLYFYKEYLLLFNRAHIEVAYSLKYNKCHDAFGWFSIVCGPVHFLPSLTVEPRFWGKVTEWKLTGSFSYVVYFRKSVLAC